MMTTTYATCPLCEATHPSRVRGRERCTAHVHRDDVERLRFNDGALARVSGIPVELAPCG
jgi:hypothetical protein